MALDYFITFSKDYFGGDSTIPLHQPCFKGRESELVLDTIESTFVSTVGRYVDIFEKNIASFIGSNCSVATVNGTAALHIALKICGVKSDDIVITQALSFVATANAITYCGAEPAFIDVDKDTLGLSPTALEAWLIENCYSDCDGLCRLKNNHKIVRACVPMHTFGHPVKLDELISLLEAWNITLVEDAAESFGSKYKGKHTGNFGKASAFSFNGNKIITTGGGGAIISSEKLGKLAKHITTTAKIPHPYEYIHDDIGYNYRMPNINAALGCAQLESFDAILEEKRTLAKLYEGLFKDSNVQFIKEPDLCKSNYWLNAIICENLHSRNYFLEETIKSGIQTRPIWKLLTDLEMYKNCITGSLTTSKWLQNRVVNIPSSVKP